MNSLNPVVTPKRILLIPLRFVGDTVLTLPLIQGLQGLFPNATIDWWANNATGELVTAQPGLNQVIIEPPRTEDWTPLLKQGRYDVAIILRQSWTMAKRCRQAGIPTLIGWDRQRFPKPVGFQRWGLALDGVIPYPASDTRVHQVHHQWGMLNHLASLSDQPAPPIPRHIPLTLDEQVTRQADEWLLNKGLAKNIASKNPQPEKPWVLCHGSSASGQKQLDKAVFTEAIRWLNRRGVAVVVTGLADDRPAWETLAQQTQATIINSCGETTLPMLAAIAQRAHGYLGLDSGPAHLAATYPQQANLDNKPPGKPFVVVVGPTNIHQWQSFGVATQDFQAVHYQPDDSLAHISQKILQATTDKFGHLG